ncbi:MAG: dephospho-CoA kinase [Candidatus Electrothrix sp. AR4]|nr:dephospho-CoA kinase [Candidatus Electrothrix sp. AR4]
MPYGSSILRAPFSSAVPACSVLLLLLSGKEERRVCRNTAERTVIGVTGGIGSGKSRVCAYMAERYRFPFLNLDLICKQLLMPDEPGWLALREVVPGDFFTASGALDRKIFRNALFADTALRSRVDAVLHPLARVEMNNRAALLNGRVLVEIPLLFEAGWQDAVQLIVVVYADLSVRLRRIVQRDQVTTEQAVKAVDAQRCLVEKASLADYVIDNSFSWRYTCAQLQQFFGVLGSG